jgi:hypothetical protein
LEGGIEPPPQAFQANTLPLSYSIFMKKISLYQLAKKNRNHSNISIFFNSRTDKNIRYGYRYVQKAFREPKRLKFLKINVRKPRLPIKRKTRYGKFLQARQKVLYLLNFGRLHKLTKYSIKNNQRGKFSRLSSFSNSSLFDLHTSGHVFSLTENPSFNFFLGRYYNQEVNRYYDVNRSFTWHGFHSFSLPVSGFFYNYTFRVFRIRSLIKLFYFYVSQKDYFFNFKTFSIYPFSKVGYPSQDKKMYGFFAGQRAFGKLR